MRGLHGRCASDISLDVGADPRVAPSAEGVAKSRGIEIVCDRVTNALGRRKFAAGLWRCRCAYVTLIAKVRAAASAGCAPRTIAVVYATATALCGTGTCVLPMLVATGKQVAPLWGSDSIVAGRVSEARGGSGRGYVVRDQLSAEVASRIASLRFLSLSRWRSGPVPSLRSRCTLAMP